MKWAPHSFGNGEPLGCVDDTGADSSNNYGDQKEEDDVLTLDTRNMWRKEEKGC